MKTPGRFLIPALALLALAGWFHFSPRGAGGQARAAVAAVQTPAGASADLLRFPEGAPQLAMLHTDALAAVPLPLSAEPLSARVAYDEDVTARIGVPISGRIVRLAASTGQTVRAGQALAEIDSPDVGSAVADLAKARADEDHKRSVLQRAQALRPGDGIAAREADAAQADLQAAEAESARARQRLANLNPRGAAIVGQRIVIASPLAGVVTERSATPALEVAPGMAAPLFVVTDPTRLWLMVDLPDGLAARVQRGRTVAVESDAFPGQRFTARVVETGQLVDPNSRRVNLRALLPNPGRKLLPEMFVRAWLLQDSGTAVRVPMTAIVDRGVHSFVFVMTAPRQFERREVRLASRGGDVGYVDQGLRGGEEVVTSGALLLDAEMADRAGARGGRS